MRSRNTATVTLPPYSFMMCGGDLRQSIVIRIASGLLAVACSGSARPRQLPTRDAAADGFGRAAPLAPCPATDQPDARVETISDCDAMGQSGMNDCATADAEKAELELAELLRQVRERRAKDRVFLTQFNAAQNAWHKFREAEIRSIYAHADDGTVSYGSAYPMCVASLRAGMTEKRLQDMQQWLVGVAGLACNSELPESESPR